MKHKGLLLTIFASGTLLLTGCSNNAQTGAVIGSLVGAGIGKSTANHRDRRAGVGAVVGGLVGAAIGQEQDRKIAASRASQGNVATTSPYYNGSSHSHATTNKQVAAKPSITHKHGNRTHSHPGGTGHHVHNTGTSNANTAHHHSHSTNTRTVYVERPYYPVSTSIVLGSGYYHYPRRYYRHRHYHRNHRHYNKHRNRHHRMYRNRYRHH